MSRHIWFVVTLLVLLSLACNFSYSIGSTATPEATSTQSPTNTPSSQGATTAPSSIVAKVTLAKGVSNPQIEPINPTTTFSPTDKIYAVVALKDAPDGTKVTSTWFVVNVGDAAKPNSIIASTSLVRSGTLNLDFSLTPTNSTHTWPVGTYKVEILVNDRRVKTLEYSVK